MDPRIDRWLFAYAIVAWCVAILVQLAIAMPLQHDEAHYVVSAQRWLAGGPNVCLYCSVGTEVLVLPAVAADASPAWLRLVPALCTLLVPIGAWALSRAAFPGRAIGGWTAAVLATAHPMIVRVGEILSDLPAAGLLLVGLAILLREIERPTWRLALAALACAAAFYVRYGSAPALAAISLATLIFYFAHWRSLLVLAVAMLVLAIPFVWFSYAQTGELFGVFTVATRSTALVYLGEGLVTYATSNPFAYYGALATPAMLLGVYGTFASRDRRALYLGTIAIATLVLLGVRSHAQPRYAFFVVALLVVVGVAQLARVLATRPRVQLAAAIVLVVASSATVAWSAYARPARVALPSRTAKLGETIRDDARGRPCRIVSARYPQLAYYSGCMASVWPGAPTTGPVYFVVFPTDPEEPPPGGAPVAGNPNILLYPE
jgi:hypothetical protein